MAMSEMMPSLRHAFSADVWRSFRPRSPHRRVQGKPLSAAGVDPQRSFNMFIRSRWAPARMVFSALRSRVICRSLHTHRGRYPCMKRLR
jgi:hypothetical protein